MSALQPRVLTSLAGACLLLCCSGGQSRVGEPIRQDGGDASVSATPAGEAPEGAAQPYRLAPTDAEGRVKESGALEVVVSWPEPPGEALRSPGLNPCGDPSRAPLRVFVRTKKQDVTALRGAVVTLVDIERGRRPDEDEPVELAVQGCTLRPAVARAARLGGRLAILNDDERRHQVVVEHLGDGGDQPALLARVPLPLVGQRYEIPLDRPGVVRARTSIDPRDHAYVVVPPHPYVAVADDRGVARLAQVPAGEHRVVAWHPPLRPGGEPLRAGGRVTVKAGTTTRAVLRIAP